MFQFLYGTIKINDEIEIYSNEASFNSYMVRLKYNTTFTDEVKGYCFNSYMVRLKWARLSQSVGLIIVSIPIWYD